ncbi:DUF1642 domain-containing protein [Lactococcus lactis]|nr:DUF1642 domain-containing protein [Lactococcus lactis]
MGKEEIEEKLETLPIKVIKHPVGNTKYYAAVHVKSLIAQADEEFQELFDRYSNLNDNYEKEVIRSSKLESQIIELKSQLQQQALPVVPESVSEIIEYAKNNKTSIRWFFTEDAYMFPEAMDWYTGSAKGIVDDIYAERQCSLINAFITGKYVVEKPQLFYLREKNTNYYLNKSKNNGLELVPNPYFDEDNQFTQQEIDSMQTGSYEQIEVKE